MRTRTQSGVHLDQIMLIVQETILKYQNPVTGLFSNNPENFPTHAWIRDNIYAALGIWALYRAYHKSAELEDDQAKARELGLNCVKVMQSILECMMRQVEKVENFKRTQKKSDSLHAKYSTTTKSTVVDDNGWGHLQIDAISLFLLVLAQMTASGLQIVRNFDEVAFIQNLVYYIENVYRIPDYGIWERGDKTNQGIRELNVSSIGMAKAAMQALNDVGDLFGDGSKSSSIHVLPDEIQQCSAVLTSMLPSESFSKETDAALLSIISYPAFAVEDQELVELTRKTILEVLGGGRYGLRRFLRDGYKTALEDPNRLHYFNSELQKFENIECEWPVFICYLLLDAIFRHDGVGTRRFWRQLQEVLIPDPNHPTFPFILLVPELYKITADKVDKEREEHGSQDRIPGGATPFLWAQSLYIICCLLHDGFLTPPELDPLSRRLLLTEKKPPCEVQVVLLAENPDVQRELLVEAEVDVQLITEVDPMFSIQPASVLAKILTQVGQSEKLKLTGRPIDRDVQLLSTSKLFHIGNKYIAFTPQFMDNKRSHLWYDTRTLINEWSSELQYIYNSWNTVSISGRPLVVLIISTNMLQLEERQKGTIFGAIKKIKNGYIGGARVVMKNIEYFFRTTTVSKLEFREENIDEELFTKKNGFVTRLVTQPDTPVEPGTPGLVRRSESLKSKWTNQFKMIHQASLRHRSIVLDSTDADLLRLRLRKAAANAAELDSSIPRFSISSIEPTSNEVVGHLNKTIVVSPPDWMHNESQQHHHSTSSFSSVDTQSSQLTGKLSHAHLEGLAVDDLIDMLMDAVTLDEQASIVHFLWLKLGPQFDSKLGNCPGVTVRVLMEEIYTKACECRDWSWVRITGGLLGKQMDELDKAVTHLLVRQKQITVGMPTKGELAITSPKSKDELHSIFNQCYGNDPNSFIIAQELIVSLGSLVRNDPRLFAEMFRLRIGLIIQVLASELARLKSLSADEATQHLLSLSPFEVKFMLFSLLSGRLLEEPGPAETMGVKETNTGMGSFRQKIEERKSLRKSKSLRAKMQRSNLPPTGPGKALSVSASKATSTIASQQPATNGSPDHSDSDSELMADDFQFGIWLRHRRIDGALNRVPHDFYANLWDTVRIFPHGLSIDGIILDRSLTQEMTRREIKFALEVEQVLNQLSEPEYREIVVEVLTLLGHLKTLIAEEPQIPQDRPFEVETVVRQANWLFVEHNIAMETIVMECCGEGGVGTCDGAREICKHFYDSAPCGEFGTVHYIIRALIAIFAPAT